FSNEIEAWKNGPVVREVYVNYRYYELWDEKEFSVSSSVQKILELALSLFDSFTSRELVNLTHEEEPWMKYEKEVSEYKNPCIPNEEIKEYYQSKFGDLLESHANEEIVCFEDKIFTYDKRETILTEDDLEILKNNFMDEEGSNFFVYKDEGELVVY
ncbi:TPA: Panacea domain-containing protein, partial [Streptococcus suis]